jgi:ADP-ribose pyrophosphatase
VFVKQYRWNLKDYGLELPAGTVRDGEGPDVAAARELLEETGFEVEPRSLEALGRYYVLPSETNKYLRVYQANAVRKRGQPTRDQEIERYFDMSVVEMTLDEAVDSIGVAIQGIETTAALLLAKRSRQAANP